MSWLDDDGGPEVIAVEDIPAHIDVHRQALAVRVGPVYRDGVQQRTPGIWVEYITEYMECEPGPPVLLDESTWRELNRAVTQRLRTWRWQRCKRVVTVWWELLQLVA